MVKPIRFLFPILFYCLLSHPLLAQEIKGSLRFDEDSLDLGRPTKVWMEIQHPSDVVVVFPDSASDFDSWEIAEAIPFATETKNQVSTDKKAYLIRSFEIDSMQYLRLPYRFLLGPDTVLRFTDYDSIAFRTRIPVMPDSAVFFSHAGLTDISDTPDYLLWGLIIVVVHVFIGLLFVLLRKPIRRVFAMRKLEKEWKKVTERLGKTQQLIPQPQAFMNEVNFIWKHYLDPQKHFSLATLSSSELAQTLPQLAQLDSGEQNALLQLSQKADLVLYAGKAMNEQQLISVPQQLQDVLKKEFERRKAELAK